MFMYSLERFMNPRWPKGPTGYEKPVRIDSAQTVVWRNFVATYEL